MIAEVSLFGVFIDTGLVTALAAACVTLLLRRGFAGVGLYRRVWHPALMDAAVFVLVWMLCVWTGNAFGDRLAGWVS